MEPRIEYGPLGSEYENSLCVNKEGLEGLKRAIEKTAKTGESESLSSDIDRIVLLDDEQFASLEPQKPNLVYRIFGWGFGIAFLAVFIIGLGNIIRSALSLL